MYFLGKLIDRLEFKRDRMVIIPGNHDVNRKDCLHYFEKSSVARLLRLIAVSGCSGPSTFCRIWSASWKSGSALA